MTAIAPALLLLACRTPARTAPVTVASVDTANARVDTLVALATTDRATCVTVLEGSSYCWGEDVGPRPGETVRLRAEDARPAGLERVIRWSPRSCGQSADGASWCERDSTHAASCTVGLCLGRLPARGSFPARAIASITTGVNHACALATNGDAFCWGRNVMGQLGHGDWAADTTGSGGAVVETPVAVVGDLRFTQLSAGEQTTCGLARVDGAVYCWGYGQSGQTGDTSVMHGCGNGSRAVRPFGNRSCSNAVPNRVLPESLPGDFAIPRDLRFVRVSAGTRLACAASVDGGAWCWGNNYRCALGRCRSPDSPRAHRIAVPGRVVEVGAGYHHACARTADGRVFCWGDNMQGQLGSLVTVNAGLNGEPPDYRDSSDVGGRAYADPCFLGGRCSPAAVEVAPGRRWAALSVASAHACAVSDDDGGVYCWGGTSRAALGAFAYMIPCTNRSATWKDETCQPRPVQVPGIPRLRAPRDLLAVLETPPRRSRADSTRVFVSGGVARIAFPRDTSLAWGWSASTAADYRAAYGWSMTVDTPDGMQGVRLDVVRTDGRAREFPSLESLVAAGRRSACSYSDVGVCADSASVSAQVVDGGVVLVLRDSARVDALFGLRPAWVRASITAPDELPPYPEDSVRVDYLGPLPPPPDSARLADAARRRRAHQASERRVTNGIEGGAVHAGALWLGLGDSAEVSAAQWECHYDMCMGRALVSVAGWTIADPRIATEHAPAANAPAARGRLRIATPAGSRVVVGRRVGRTTLTVRGVRADEDSEADSTADSSAETAVDTASIPVVVTPPVGRVRITAYPRSVAVGAYVPVTVLVTSRAGRPIEGAPALVTVTAVGAGPSPTSVGDVTGRGGIGFYGGPGLRRMVASFGGRADTVYVEVAAPPAR